MSSIFEAEVHRILPDVSKLQEAHTRTEISMGSYGMIKTKKEAPNLYLRAERDQGKGRLTGRGKT